MEAKERAHLEVVDKKTEISVFIGNILQFLVLAVLSWVGVNIQLITKDISQIKTKQAVQYNESEHIKSRLERHISNAVIHSINHVHIK